VSAITVYWATGCHLCEPALTTARAVGARIGVPVIDVDISGDAALERRYRTAIPVVELDGRRLAKYFVDEADLETRVRRRLAALD